MRRVGQTVLVVGMLLSPPATAQDIDADQVRACRSAGGKDCVGQAAADCVANGGAEGLCLAQELAVWTAELDIAHASLFRLIEEQDAGLDAILSAAPRSGEALLYAHRAWNTWRGAHCAWEATRNGGGPQGGITYTACQLSMTAAQTLNYDDHFEERVQ